MLSIFLNRRCLGKVTSYSAIRAISSATTEFSDTNRGASDPSILLSRLNKISSEQKEFLFGSNEKGPVESKSLFDSVNGKYADAMKHAQQKEMDFYIEKQREHYIQRLDEEVTEYMSEQSEVLKEFERHELDHFQSELLNDTKEFSDQRQKECRIRLEEDVRKYQLSVFSGDEKNNDGKTSKSIDADALISSYVDRRHNFYEQLLNNEIVEFMHKRKLFYEELLQTRLSRKAQNVGSMIEEFQAKREAYYKAKLERDAEWMSNCFQGHYEKCFLQCFSRYAWLLYRQQRMQATHENQSTSISDMVKDIPLQVILDEYSRETMSDPGRDVFLKAARAHMLQRFFVRFQRKPSEAYALLVRRKDISVDENQVSALPVFDRLYEDLSHYVTRSKVSPPPPRSLELRPPNRLGIIPSFFLKRLQDKKISRALSCIDGEQAAPTFHPLSLVKGLYVWGGVGCGKTLLMDLLYDNLPMELKKHRIHFHQFMLDVQKTAHTIQYLSKEEIAATKRKTGFQPFSSDRRTPEAQINVFEEIAQRMIGNVELLCFDEVAVADVADAMILKRLFMAFYRIGVVVIFTSNRPPDQLYLGGLNRGSFLPFIDLVEKMNITYHLKSETDHRLMGSRSDTYFCPFGEEKEKAFNQLFLECCKGLPTSKRLLRVFGRDITVERACGDVCYFHFHELCGSTMSGADYQVIAKTFHTVFINGVPQFPYQASDVKNRFLILIDTLYEFHCKLIIYAAVEPHQIQEEQERDYLALEGHKKLEALSTQFEKEMGKQLIDNSDSSFQMERCVSRLIEMRSKEYLKVMHRPTGPHQTALN